MNDNDENVGCLSDSSYMNIFQQNWSTIQSYLIHEKQHQ